MGQWLATSWVGGLFKTFVGVVLAGFLLFLQNGGSLTNIKGSDVMTWVTAAIIVVVPVIINALNPADARYGTTKS